MVQVIPFVSYNGKIVFKSIRFEQRHNIWKTTKTKTKKKQQQQTSINPTGLTSLSRGKCQNNKPILDVKSEESVIV